MAKSGSRKNSERREQARGRVVDAAIEALKENGFAGASAREIARVGGFTQGVVFYHFGSMDEVLIAALERISAQRMEQYRAAVDSATTIVELIEVASRIYREDLESGHLKVLAELIAASSSNPELGKAVSERIAPWVDFTADAVGRFLGDSGLAALLPARDAAFAVVALLLGVEMLVSLDANNGPAESLVRSATSLGTLLAPLIGPAQTEATR